MMYSSLIAICWIIFILVWLALSGDAKKSIKGKRQYSGPALLMVTIITVAMLLLHTERLSYLITFHLFPSAAWVQYMGILICGTGIGFAVWARIRLGTNWGMPMSLKDKPDLITTGPYHFVRHPIYTGLCAAMMGSMVIGGFVWLVWILISFPFFIYSAKREEKSMLLQFPDEYPGYMRRTKMLIPFIF